MIPPVAVSLYPVPAREYDILVNRLYGKFSNFYHPFLLPTFDLVAGFRNLPILAAQAYVERVIQVLSSRCVVVHRSKTPLSSCAWHQFRSPWGNASHWLMQRGNRHSAVPRGTDASKSAKRVSERLKGASDGRFKRGQYERKGMGHSDRWKSRSRHSASDPRPRTNHRSGPAIPRTRSANNCDPAEPGKAT